MSKLNNLTKDLFDKEVTQNTGIVIVEFGAEWCGPCKALAPVLEQLSAEAGEAFKVFTVDVDDEVELTKQFGIRSVPAVLIFKNGKEVKRNVGTVSKANLLKMLE